MNDQSKKASVAEIYASLKQLIDAYEMVMNTFSSVIGDVVEMKADIAEVERFVNEKLVDSVQAGNLWRANAKIHREAANRMRVQLHILADQGCKIEMDIPVLTAVLDALPEIIEGIEGGDSD